MHFNKLVVFLASLSIAVPGTYLFTGVLNSNIMSSNNHQVLAASTKSSTDKSPHRGTGRREFYQVITIAEI